MKSIQKQPITIYAQNGKTDTNPDPKIIVIPGDKEWSVLSTNVFIDESTFLKISWFKQKRLYLYLFRNKHIRQIIHDKNKLIEVRPLLRYLWNTIQTLENQRKTNKKTQ